MAALFSDAQKRAPSASVLVRCGPTCGIDLSAVARVDIRMALAQAGDSTAAQAEPAFEFFQPSAADPFDDALAALDFLATRWPVVVAVSFTAMPTHRIGIGAISPAYATQPGALPDARIFPRGRAGRR